MLPEPSSIAVLYVVLYVCWFSSDPGIGKALSDDSENARCGAGRTVGGTGWGPGVQCALVADQRLSNLYGALADETRRSIVARLVRGEHTVAELRAPLAMSAPAVSKHLRVLEAAGLIEGHRQGRHQLCRVSW